MEFYTSEPINENITLIRSVSGELLYLIEGEAHAVLIDTCLGVGHLKDYVESLCKKPLLVLLSHGHVDHAPGAAEFQTVYMNEADQKLYKKHCRMQERKGYLQANLGPRFAELDEADFVKEEPEKEFHDLRDGMNFDLGGVHVEAYALPGHTKGCMVFLIPECKVLITGDACNNATFLFDENSLTVEEYQKNVDHVKKLLEGRYEHVFVSHHVMEQSKDILEEMDAVCNDILQDQADDLPFDFMGMQACIAKKCNERFEREDGKSANLIYSKTKINSGQ